MSSKSSFGRFTRYTLFDIDTVRFSSRKTFKALNLPTVLHICGSTDHVIEMINECHADTLSVDHKNNIVESGKKAGNNTLLFGNFDPYSTPCRQIDAQEVRPIIKRCIEDGVNSVRPVCDIWPDVKKENVEHMFTQ